jgi:hypothetical protein
MFHVCVFFVDRFDVTGMSTGMSPVRESAALVVFALAVLVLVAPSPETTE